MPSNIRLENKIENPRIIRERYKKPKQRIIRERHHVRNGLVTEASLILISNFFSILYLYYYFLYWKQLQEKKTVAKHKRKPSHTLHGRKMGKTGFMQKRFGKI
jgi:hypothetical protein